MHKRKYTKEQLEFYFKQLMEKLHRIPREEDMQRAKNSPSVQAYTDRFGSWNNAVALFANFDLAKRKCLNCHKVLIKTKKTHKFCSDKCAHEYYSKKTTTYTKSIHNKILGLLGNKCHVCDFDAIVEIHCLDNRKESNSKILKTFNKKDMNNYVLLCPNHHLMVHKKLGKIYHRDGEIVWEEY
jgi:hypothetical protein